MPDPENLPDNLIPGAEPFAFGEGEHALLFLHGWGSSPRELRFLAEKLSGKYFCRGVLLHGHGTRPSDLNRFRWREHLRQVEMEFADLAMTYRSVSVVGFSYGGLLALHLAARRRVRRLALLAPYLGSPKLSRLGWQPHWLVPCLPRFITALPKFGSGPIRDPEAAASHIIYPNMPMASLKSVVESLRQVKPLLPLVHCDTLILHAVEDKTSGFWGSVEALKYLGSRRKLLAAYNRSNHVLTLDYDRPEVEAQIEEWLIRNE